MTYPRTSNTYTSFASQASGESVLTRSGYVFDTGLVWGMSIQPATFSEAPPTDPLVIITWA